jgi:hypothetical protein
VLKLTEADLTFLENRHDGEESTWSREEAGCKMDSLADAVMVPAAPQGGAVAGEVRKTCRPGE